MSAIEARVRSFYKLANVIAEVIKEELEEASQVDLDYLKGFHAGQQSTWSLVRTWLAEAFPEQATDGGDAHQATNSPPEPL